MSSPNKINNTKVAASVAGGITLVINAAVGYFGRDLSLEERNTLVNLSPLVGSGIAAALYFLWDCFGVSPEQIRFERQVNKQIKRAQKDMQDQALSEEARQAAQADHECYRELLRTHNMPESKLKVSS